MSIPCTSFYSETLFILYIAACATLSTSTPCGIKHSKSHRTKSIHRESTKEHCFFPHICNSHIIGMRVCDDMNAKRHLKQKWHCLKIGFRGDKFCWHFRMLFSPFFRAGSFGKLQRLWIYCKRKSYVSNINSFATVMDFVQCVILYSQANLQYNYSISKIMHLNKIN
jgi:hypothetical protein